MWRALIVLTDVYYKERPKSFMIWAPPYTPRYNIIIMYGFFLGGERHLVDMMTRGASLPGCYMRLIIEEIPSEQT